MGGSVGPCSRPTDNYNISGEFNLGHSDLDSDQANQSSAIEYAYISYGKLVSAPDFSIYVRGISANDS